MPKVLIIGATGYLGSRLCDVLVHSGEHRVYGIARNETKARSLALAEITPVICPDPINNPVAYLDAIRNFHIDIVVDVSGANQSSAQFLADVKNIGQERLNNAKLAGLAHMPKLGFVYCSGTWVHGSSDKQVNDTDVVGPNAPTPPAQLVAWRVDHENAVLAASDVLDVAVIRPALIYGGESTIWTPFILPLLQASRGGSPDNVQIPLSVDSRPGLVHVDDVATGFQKAIEKLALINGGSVCPIFDLVTSRENMTEIFSALASHWGYKGRYELLLGWTPTRLNGFVADMDIYADAFASQH
ncbi:hypothetical protein NW752_001300 [Fusarium irregulare]|nr:hypothetical protein NW752_001300 [Fusarium irregulare]